MPKIHPVLLCGGSGTRLWPLSRASYPKQFVALTGEDSLFQASALRLSGGDFAAPTVVTAADFRFLVAEQLQGVGIDPADVLIEPEGRNTAPAVLAAALHLSDRDPDALMLVAPSDHVIPEVEAFKAAIDQGVPPALDGKLVTFGVEPSRPETGYGYLQLMDDCPPRFIEKPDAGQAAEMLQTGGFLWNAGIFLFTARAILAAFQTHAPDLLRLTRAAMTGATSDLGFLRLRAEAWVDLPSISIDYAVMERAANLAVVPYPGEWSDLGDWDAVMRAASQDASGVALQGPATAIDCRNTLLRSEDDGLELVGLGLENVVAVAMPDAVLVANANRTQEVRLAVDRLKAKRAKQATQAARDHRPWGWFESLVQGNRFQVKRISVDPGAALSLQSHHHRAEHWIVVQGTAKVTVGNEVNLVTENQSVYVPLGVRHRMENPGKLPVVLIEVQTGGYLGEDDITRYEDVYARA